MKDRIEEFERTKDYLVCVDSDGCAIDAMTIKHEKCFGPKAIEVWHLEDYQDRFMDEWMKVNCFSRTRGINRFKALVAVFENLRNEGLDIPDLSTVKQWTETTTELSNPSLERELAKTNDEQLKLTLDWSIRTNQAIAELPKSKPFPHVKEGLQFVHEHADIAIVSSANSEAVVAEWTEHGLDAYVSVLCGREAGSKQYCIGQMMEKGSYLKTHVLMIGDAPGDLKAAEANDVLYYPIIPGKEAESWKRLVEEAIGKFLEGIYQGAYQKQLIEEFYDVLK